MGDRRELLNDDQEAFRVAIDGVLASLWTAIPAKIVSVDYAKRTCTCQPTIRGKIQKPDGSSQFVDLPILVDVPIIVPSAGGFTLSLPIAANDEVLVVFASRCIDSWWETGDVGVPMEPRMHDLSDGFAIVGPRSAAKATPLDSTNATLMNDTGTGGIRIAPNGNVTIISATQTNIVSPLTIFSGDLAVSGVIQTTTLTATTGASVGGKDFATHKHSGVATGSGQTGGVV